VFAAAAGTAMTFQRALMPRNTSDQAIVTGATMSLMYLATSLVHDAIESAASWVLVGGSKRQADDELLRRVAVAAEVVALGAGLALQRAVPQRRDEPLQNAAARAGGLWLSVSSFAGLASGLTEEIIDSLHERTGGRYHLNKVPVGLLGGMTFAAVREFQRRRKEALEAKRLREGPFRLIQVAGMGGWRYCIWSSSKRLLLQYAKKEGEACFVQRPFIEAEGK